MSRRLAILGGSPAFAEPLYVGRPNLGDRQRLRARLEGVLDARWLTNNGKQVQEFEHRIAEVVGVRHCVATCNATVALEIVARATGMSGEVILPSMTFVATAHALQWQGIKPVFCDIDPETHNIDVTKAEELVTEDTTGIVGVHLWGRACEVERMEKLADRYGLRLVFDAAHAIGCSYQGTPIGGFGDAEVFSFHATKVVNSFEGGAVATNDDALAEELRLLRNFGFRGYDNVVALGVNGKMNEAAAAMGITSLESLPDFVEANRVNYEAYGEGLSHVRGLTPVRYDSREKSTYQYVVFEVNADELHLERDELVRVLHAENVLARRYFYPGCHRMEPYKSLFPDATERLPETEALCRRVLVLPTGTTVSRDDVEKVCGIIRAAGELPEEIRRRLADGEAR